MKKHFTKLFFGVIILLNLSNLYALEIETLPSQATICSGQDIQLMALPFGNDGPFSFEWYEDDDTAPFQTMDGVDESMVMVNPSSDTNYTIVVTSESTGLSCNVFIPVTINNSYQVVDVLFKDGTNLEKDPAIKDDGHPYTTTENYSTDTHWQLVNGKMNPYAYLSGSTMKIEEAIIEACNPITAANIYVRATATGNGESFILDPQLATVQDNQITIGEAILKHGSTSSGNLPIDKVNLYESLTITWEISTDQSLWITAGDSEHLIYVTHKPVDQYMVDLLRDFNSIYYIGCKAAQGKTTQDEIVLAIFDEFKDRKVSKYRSNQAMGYWKQEKNGAIAMEYGCTDVIRLLAYETGTCGAWVDLIRQILYAQGYRSWAETGSVDIQKKLITASAPQGQNNVTYVSSAILSKLQTYLEDVVGPNLPTGQMVSIDYTNVKEFLTVKGWTPVLALENAVYSASVDEFSFAFDSNWTMNVFSYNGYYHLEAQGTKTPIEHSFRNHVIVEYRDSNDDLHYFDPSYGTPDDSSYGYPTEKDLENASFQYVSAKFLVKNEQQDVISQGVWPYKKISTELDLHYTVKF